MRGLDRPLAAALVLGAILCACTRQPPSPTPSPTTTPPPPEEEYSTTTHVTLLVYPLRRGCAVVAIPYYAFVKKDGHIVWDIVDDACPTADKVEISFAESGIVVVEMESDETPAGAAARAPHRKKKGKITGAADKQPHKYTVTLGSFVHDPEIEIWP